MKLKILIYYIFFFSCSVPTAVQEIESLDRVVFEMKLPQDSNGFYILTLDKSKNQTIHTVEGRVFPPIEYKRFEWKSNLEFQMGPYLGSVTNQRSYTDKNGLFRNSIGPVLEMVGDTMKLEVRWDPRAQLDDMYFYQPAKSKTFYIILK